MGPAVLESYNLFSINEWIGELQGTKRAHVVWICCVATHQFIFTSQVPNSIHSYSIKTQTNSWKSKAHPVCNQCKTSNRSSGSYFPCTPWVVKDRSSFRKKLIFRFSHTISPSHVIASYDRFWRLLGWSIRRIDTSLLAWLVWVS